MSEKNTRNRLHVEHVHVPSVKNSQSQSLTQSLTMQINAFEIIAFQEVKNCEWINEAVKELAEAGCRYAAIDLSLVYSWWVHVF